MRFLLVFAGLLLAGALYDFLRVQRLVDDGEAVTATIVSVRVQAEQHTRIDQVRRYSFFPTLRYTVGGEEFREEANFSYSKDDWLVGRELTLLVDPDDPRHFVIDQFFPRRGMSLGMTLFALATLALWALFWLKGRSARREERALEQLRLQGRRVRATVSRIDRLGPEVLLELFSDGLTKFRQRGATDPWTVFAQWESPTDGKVHEFQSKGLRQDPGVRAGDLVDVYLDQNDPEHYAISLPSKR